MALTLNLPQNQEMALKARAQAFGISAEEYVQKMLDRELEQQEGPAVGNTRRHISEVVRDIMSDVPREVFETLPKDGSREHDHYLYGSPKHGQ